MITYRVKIYTIIRKGDYKLFENCLNKANSFHNRLIEMGLERKAENSNFKRTEKKLNHGDMQKWLESWEAEINTRNCILAQPTKKHTANIEFVVNKYGEQNPADPKKRPDYLNRLAQPEIVFYVMKNNTRWINALDLSIYPLRRNGI